MSSPQSLFIILCVLLVSCSEPVSPPVPAEPATEAPEAPAPAAASVEEAQAYIADAETRLAEQYELAGRVAWINANFITPDTDWLAARVGGDTTELGVELAGGTRRFEGLTLPEETRRKMNILRTGMTLPAPDQPGAAQELAEITTWLSSTYGTGKAVIEGQELDLPQLEEIINHSRDPEALEAAWTGWRTIAEPMADPYARMVEIANAGARELGFTDLAGMWLSSYEMSPAAMEAEVQRLWGQVEPLYEALHCHVRAELSDYYGDAVQPPQGPIRADLLGNMWAQQWSNIYDIVAPPETVEAIDLTSILEEKGFSELDMVRAGENFFVSLGFEPLPETFWERSLFTQPDDREVVCHASAWDITPTDFRIKMCIRVNAEDFQTIHHELGHNFYQRAYSDQDLLFRNGAHDGFHEAIGDFVGLSITPEYLQAIDLLDTVPDSAADTGLLMQQALDKIAFLPFGLLVDQWRWKVLRGEVGREQYNEAWWELREQYQGITPPSPRPAEAFDPGAKYHIPGNTPYLRYFLSFIMQFQFHAAACEIAGWEGPLHRCSIYRNTDVGERLKAMLEKGTSVPWPQALEAFTGSREMDASAIIAYFEPLMSYLEGRTHRVSVAGDRAACLYSQMNSSRSAIVCIPLAMLCINPDGDEPMITAKANRYRLLAASLLAGLLLSAGSSAQNTAPDLNLSYEKFTLDNGLRVIVHEDRKAPIVAVSVWYHVGSKNEPEGKTGFAHLFEHLMFNGSENYNGEWFEPMQNVGATGMNGTTWLDRTNYFQNVPTPALDLALWMESDRMGHLLGAVTQEKLDNQRGVVQNEKRQGDNQPYGRVNYNLYEGIFPPGHPYRHSTIGSMEDLNAASLDDVQQWFRDYYGPNNAVLSLAGDIDLATAREKVQRFFGDIPAGPQVDAVQRWVPVRDTNSSEIQYDSVPAVLANRAWPVPPRTTRDKALLDLAAAVIAGGDNSRLHRELVYERQVASSVSVNVTPFELASVFDLSVMLNPGEEAAVATEAMDSVIAEFLAEGPDASELERVVTSINASTVRGLEQVGGFSGKAAQLAEGEIYANDPLFINQYLAWINAATPEEVQAVAQDWLSNGWHQVNVLPRPALSATDTRVDRSTGLPPLPEVLPELTFPDIERATLDNGIEVVLAQRSTVPVVSLSMQFDAGFAADAGNKLGVASFAMEMLDKGSASRSALEISDEAERLGAIINAGSNLDASFVNLSALTDNLRDSVGLWADVILNPVFAEDEIERLRRQRITAIAQEKAQPVGLAQRLLPPVLYGEGHAYAVPFSGTGTEESLQSITQNDLADFQASWLRPDNARIFVVGDTTLDDVLPVLERAFQGWDQPDAPLPVKNISQVSLPDDNRLILIDRAGSPQSFILAGHVVPGLGTERDLALEAMNDVLGGTFTARINMNLREEKGWSYGAQTILQSARGQRPFLVYAPVQTDRTADSLAELVMELDALKTGMPITEPEMARVIAGSTRELPGQFETSQAVLNSLVTSARYGRPLDYAASLTDSYLALELQDLQAAAEDLVQPQSLVWIVVGDLAEIRDEVEALNIAPVEIWTDDGEPVSSR